MRAQTDVRAPLALQVKAWAKVNLALEIVGRRPDGYHDIETVMHRIELADDIEVARGANSMRSGEQTIRVEVARIAANIAGAGVDEDSQAADDALVPSGRGNIAFRAAQAFLARLRSAGPGAGAGASASVRIRIRKRIPIGAGLGGGSADAAAVLAAMNRLWENPFSCRQLMDLAARIGADVPFCLANHALAGNELTCGGVRMCGPVLAAFAHGIGERLIPLAGLPGVGLVLINPGYSVSTAEAYAKWDEGYAKDAERGASAQMARAMAGAIRQDEAAGAGRRDLRCICALMSNDFEPLVAEKYGQVLKAKQLLMEAGAIGALMSGSGPTVFGVFDSPGRAETAAKALRLRVDGHFQIISTYTGGEASCP